MYRSGEIQILFSPIVTDLYCIMKNAFGGACFCRPKQRKLVHTPARFEMKHNIIYFEASFMARETVALFIKDNCTLEYCRTFVKILFSKINETCNSLTK
jgi:hypothetical protein